MLKAKFLPFSKLILPALLACTLLFAVIIRVYAAPISVTTTFTNVAPSFSGNASDGSSDVSTPTNVGSNVAFTATANDSNHDSYWLAICISGGSITPSGTGGAPTCTAGNWCISSSAVAYNTQNSCNYTVLQGDAESNNWEAYVCDNRTPSLCSAVNTGSGVTGSPFHVNHPPVIGTVYAGTDYGNNTSIDPGNLTTGVVRFQAGVTDPDTSDTIDMFVCNDATTAFDASTGTCTGGATICSVTGVTSGNNAQCQHTTLAAIPTAHGSYQTHIYLRDNSSTKLANAVTNKSYTITDVAPTASGFSIGQNPLVPVVSSSVNQTYSATLNDNNGYADITSAKGVIYVSPGSVASDGTCTADSEIDCYDTPTCTLSGGSGTTIDASCGAAGNLITTWFNISPSSSWKAHLAVVSDLGTSNMATEGSFTVNSLNTILTAEATIPYGALGVGDTSSAQTITIQNGGNIITDALVSGTNMTSGGNTIARSQQHWSPSSSWTWGSGDYALVASAPTPPAAAAAGCSDRTIAVTSSHSSYTTSPIYWKIQIPGTQATGTYTGTTNFVGTPNDCTGGV